MSPWRALLRGVLAGLVAALLALAASTPAVAADVGTRAAQGPVPLASELPRVPRAGLSNCSVRADACGSPRIRRLIRAHRLRDYGATMLVVGPSLGAASVGIAVLTFDPWADIGGNLPSVVPMGAAILMVVASPFVLGAATRGGRSLLFGEDRKVGTVLLTSAFFVYVAAGAIVFSTPQLGGGALAVGGGLYAVGTGLLWAAANDSLGKARRVVGPDLTLAPQLLPGGAGLTVAGSFGRR